MLYEFIWDGKGVYELEVLAFVVEMCYDRAFDIQASSIVLSCPVLSVLFHQEKCLGAILHPGIYWPIAY